MCATLGMKGSRESRCFLLPKEVSVWKLGILVDMFHNIMMIHDHEDKINDIYLAVVP